MSQTTKKRPTQPGKYQKSGKRQASRRNIIRKNSSGPVWAVLGTALLLVAFLCFFAAAWYLDTYGDTGFDSIMYTLSSDLGGVQSGLIVGFLLGALLPTVLCTAAVSVVLFFWTKKPLVVGGRKLLPLPKTVARVTALVLSLVLILHAAFTTGLPAYISDQISETEIFEKTYVDPNSVEITFPEEKRNLIYIYLESMETTYLSKELGGAEDVNLIPELYDLAAANINFSQNKGVGGFLPVTGATWTIAAMVAHTAGVPLKTPPGVSENDYGQADEGFLPGITSITDILHEAGYYQTLMVGSVASFGGRRQYYTQHGADYIYDLSTARKDGIVPSDYFVWWGMEDKYLFQYAREELEKISQQDQPFAFTMLTVDTHHIGGYQCSLCGTEREEQYENVMSCSSKQVALFVEWLQKQDFYENTTIIITGDHPSMDNGYFERNIDEDYTRRMYNCFINTAVDTAYSKNRSFSALDMFPTTLAAIGCQIEGGRLGLGTNLFSGKPTLIETMGYDRFDSQISMASDYYAEVFRLEEPEDPESETEQ